MLTPYFFKCPKTISFAIVLIVVGTIWPKFAFAQKNVQTHQAVWYQLFSTVELNTKWYVLTDIQERRFASPKAVQHMYLIRPRLYRRLGHNWDAALGFVFAALQPNNPLADPRPVQPEYRPFLEFTNRQTLSTRVSFTQRYVFEQRFQRKLEAGKLVDGFVHLNRLRYRLNVDVDLFKVKSRSVKLRVNDEVLVQFGKNVKVNVFDHNRLQAGLVFPVTKSLSFEAGYTHWFQELATGVDFYERHILRLCVLHKMVLKKDEKKL